MDIVDDVDPRSGVAFMDVTGAHPVIRLPRNESLRILPKSGMMNIYDTFDATIPHCISSRCHDSDEIMCVSFYLKSLVVGMNDNSMPLSRDQMDMSSFHDNLEANTAS